MTHEHPAAEAAAGRAEHDGRPGHDGRPSGAADQSPAMTGELTDLLARIVPPDGGFRHRQHIHLAYLTVLRHGTAEAAVRIGQWIRQLAAYERAPQKYNATVTRAWTELVGFHVIADSADPAGSAGSAGGASSVDLAGGTGPAGSADSAGGASSADLAGGTGSADSAGGTGPAGEAGGDFEDFAARHPALLDKRLLTQHYSPAVLASAAARAGWVDPDRLPFPWRPGTG
jgi:hypothetical protein